MILVEKAAFGEFLLLWHFHGCVCDDSTSTMALTYCMTTVYASTIDVAFDIS